MDNAAARDRRRGRKAPHQLDAWLGKSIPLEVPPAAFQAEHAPYTPELTFRVLCPSERDERDREQALQLLKCSFDEGVHITLKAAVNSGDVGTISYATQYYKDIR